MKAVCAIAGLWAVCVVLCAHATPQAQNKRVHLFILSGQSNMYYLDPNKSFTPELRNAFPDDEVIVVKDSMGGQPIGMWVKITDVQEARGKPYKLYDSLIASVRKAIENKTPATITFVWMQGETDAREPGDANKAAELYAASLKCLYRQLRSDLKREDVDFIIGRINDYGNGMEKYPNWNVIRQTQVQAAESEARAVWVDTDDLNGKDNGIHCTSEGYVKLGKRFAEHAIRLITKADRPASAPTSSSSTSIPAASLPDLHPG